MPGRAARSSSAGPSGALSTDRGILQPMTIRPTRRLIATALLLTIALLPATSADAAKKRRRRVSRKAKAAPVKIEAATGNTLQERIASLVNGKVASSSEVSIQIVDVETGAVIGERN